MKQIKSFCAIALAMFLALFITSCGGTTITDIDAKIDKYGENAVFTQAEYAKMIEVMSEIVEKTANINDFYEQDKIEKEFEKKYPKFMDYIGILLMADIDGKLDSLNEKKLEQIKKLAAQVDD